jgi:hypothetical protein
MKATERSRLNSRDEPRNSPLEQRKLCARLPRRNGRLKSVICWPASSEASAFGGCPLIPLASYTPYAVLP